MSEPLHQFQVKAWPPERMAAFELLAPVALTIASTDYAMSVALLGKDGSVWQRFGGNRPVWPCKLGLSWSYQDNVTKSLRGADTFVHWKLRWRRWLMDDGDAAANLLAAAIARIGDSAAEHGLTELLHGRINAGAEFWRVHRFTEATIMPLARELGVKLWTDDELGQILDEASMLAAVMQFGRRPEVFKDTVRGMLAEQHALSRPRMRTVPRTPTTLIGIGAKVKPWAGDADIERQIADALRAQRKCG